MVIVKSEEALLLFFDFGKVTIPRDDIVLILIIENHLGMNKVLDDLLTSAI